MQSISIKGCGISVVIAKSFARIFFRNSINIGLPLIEIEEAGEIDEGDELEIDFEKGEIENLTKEKVYKFQKYPEFLQQIIEEGGLMKWIKTKYIKSV